MILNQHKHQLLGKVNFALTHKVTAEESRQLICDLWTQVAGNGGYKVVLVLRRWDEYGNWYLEEHSYYDWIFPTQEEAVLYTEQEAPRVRATYSTEGWLEIEELK